MRLKGMGGCVLGGCCACYDYELDGRAGDKYKVRGAEGVLCTKEWAIRTLEVGGSFLIFLSGLYDLRPYYYYIISISTVFHVTRRRCSLFALPVRPMPRIPLYDVCCTYISCKEKVCAPQHLERPNSPAMLLLTICCSRRQRPPAPPSPSSARLTVALQQRPYLSTDPAPRTLPCGSSSRSGACARDRWDPAP